MCEKNINNKGCSCLFSYRSNDRNIFISKEQAEEIWHQYCRYNYAKDLKDTIASIFEDDKVLNNLTLSDLLPYTEILEDLLRENSDEEQEIIYSDCCEDVVCHYVIKDLEKGGKYNEKEK